MAPSHGKEDAESGLADGSSAHGGQRRAEAMRGAELTTVVKIFETYYVLCVGDARRRPQRSPKPELHPQ
jgi:hypothetical protein